MGTANGADVAHDSATYSRVGWTLLGGLLVSIAVMALGLLIGAIKGGDTTHVSRLNEVWTNLTAGKPAAILDSGILLLFATPLAGVLVALEEFLRQVDNAFAGVTAVLLVLLVLGFAVALH